MRVKTFIIFEYFLKKYLTNVQCDNIIGIVIKKSFGGTVKWIRKILKR